MNSEWLTGQQCQANASRASDRRFWYCTMGCTYTNHAGKLVCDVSMDWYAICDDFGNLVRIER